jgi:hypothetical protein
LGGNCGHKVQFIVGRERERVKWGKWGNGCVGYWRFNASGLLIVYVLFIITHPQWDDGHITIYWVDDEKAK